MPKIGTSSQKQSKVRILKKSDLAKVTGILSSERRNEHRTKDRIVRSMITGRFMYSKESVRISDLGIRKIKGKTAGVADIKSDNTVSSLPGVIRRKMKTKAQTYKENPHIGAIHSAVGKKLWENEYLGPTLLDIIRERKGSRKKVTGQFRNGQQITKLVMCEREKVNKEPVSGVVIIPHV